MRYTCCLNMGFDLKILKRSAPICLSDNTRKAFQPGLIFLFAKMLRALLRCDDVMMFESLMLTPFCFEKTSVRKNVFF